MIQQRSIFYLKDPTTSEHFFKKIDQDDRDITIPASATDKVSRLEKITIPFDSIEDKLVELFDTVQLMDLKFNKPLNKCNETGIPEQTLFNDWVNENQYGMSIEVAPQKAKSFQEYKELSNETIAAMLKILHVQTKDEPIFYQEWFKLESFDLGSDELELMVLHLWNTLLKQNLELPVRLPDIECIDSMELLLHGQKREISLLMYWNTVSRPTIMSKKYALQEEPIDTEVGLFYSTSPEPYEYNPALSGLRAKINKESLQKDNTVKFHPTMVFASTTHKTLYGYESRHELLKPTGMHPTYQVSLITKDERYPLDPADQCSLYFQLDVPKQIILDQYELERYRGRSFIDFKVHNGGMDLELPEYRVPEYGGALTVELNSTYVESQGSFEIPLHLRYGKPLGEFEDVTMPKGQLYWQCIDTQPNITSQSFYNEPDRLGIDKFADKAIYYHIYDENNRCNHLNLPLPTADVKDMHAVELATLILVALATIAIVRTLIIPQNH